MPSEDVERRMLAAPDRVARAAARWAPDAQARWMLRQPRALRRSFLEEAYGRGDVAEQVWMLRQSDAVREDYVREVLAPLL